MTERPPRPAWAGWLFVAWTAIVLGFYARQLFENAAALGVRLLR